MHIKINVIFSFYCDYYFSNQISVYFKFMYFDDLQSAIMVKKSFSAHVKKPGSFNIYIFFYCIISRSQIRIVIKKGQK